MRPDQSGVEGEEEEEEKEEKEEEEEEEVWEIKSNWVEEDERDATRSQGLREGGGVGKGSGENDV